MPVVVKRMMLCIVRSVCSCAPYVGHALNLVSPAAAALDAMLAEVLPLAGKFVKEDKSLDVAMAALDAIKDVIEEVQGRALQTELNLGILLSLVKDVMHHKVRTATGRAFP